MMDMRHLPKLTPELITGIGLGLIVGGFFMFMLLAFVVIDWDSDLKRCERAVPYALVTEARSVDNTIMCKSVEVGAATETIHWLDKNGAKLDR